MSLRAAAVAGRRARSAGRTIDAQLRPSANSTMSKKHMYGLWRDSEPVTRTFVPALNMSGLIPLRVSCVTPCDSQTYSRVLPFSSAAAMCR